MNLAIADVRVLAAAPSAWYRAFLVVDDVDAPPFPDDDGGFQHRLQLSQLRYLTTSRAAATTLTENSVGLEAV